MQRHANAAGSPKPPFERVFRDHATTVLRVCRAVLGGDAEADDAAAETFLSALRAYPDLDDGANVQAWLVRIAHRKAIDVVRARQRRPVPTGEVPETAAGGGADRCENAHVWPAVAALPDKQRQVIAYRYLGGLSYAQIAEIVGGSADAARRAGADGMRSLRTALAPRPTVCQGVPQ